MIPEKYFVGKKNFLYYVEFFFRTYFKNRFFNKIFLVHICITVITCLLLLVTLTHNLISIQSDQSLLISDQVLTSIDSYIESKISNAYSIHQSLYRDSETWDELILPLLNRRDASSSESSTKRQSLNFKVTQTIYSIDKDMGGIYLYGFTNKESFQFGTAPSAPDYAFFKSWCESAAEPALKTPALISSREQTNPTNNAFSLFILNTLKNPKNFSREIGAFGVYFNAMNLTQTYRKYEPYRKGSIYIFDSTGNLLFDSEGSYLLPNSFPLKKILEVNQKKILVENGQLYNILPSRNNSYYTVNTYSMSEVMKDVHILQRSIFFIIVLIFIFTLSLGYIGTKFFAKRVRLITDTMALIKQGHLTDFEIQKSHDDEIGFIYAELIKMCAILDDHIQKEYAYQLHQKEMELYALQAQINPHFLYNTLETIRMNLYLKGDEETSKMVYILSNMFRNSMKTNMVVTIRDEVNYAKSYLELYKYRFRDRLTYELDIPDEVYRYSCIKHILQPLLENALVHGIHEKESPDTVSTIRIQICIEGTDILFTVSDNGCGIPEEHLRTIRKKLNHEELFQDSIGIYNVNSRLRIVYGPGYRLHLESTYGLGTSVTMRIKAMRKKEIEKYVQSYDC